MRSFMRLALASACATGLAAPAIASAIETTVRVEGSAQTTIPQSPQDVVAAGNTVVTDTTDGDTIAVPGRSATAQLAAATGSRGVPLGFDLFDFGSGPTSFVNRIGSDTTPPDFSAFWLFKVNHVASQVGADQALLSPGDEVLWFYGTPGLDSELDVSAPSAPIAEGKQFTVTVTRYDTSGAPSPARGTTVTYGGSKTTTNSAGAASLTATGGGTESVLASAPNAIRDSASVCGYPAGDPTVCGLAAPPGPGMSPGVAPEPAAVCRDLGSGSATRSSVASLPPSDANYRRIQWYARVTMQRVAAMTAWLDAGIEPGDICGGTFGQAAFVSGVTLADGGPGGRASPPSPRSFALKSPPAPKSGTGAPASPALARSTRAISIEALKRTNALAARVRGGLTGGDLRAGSIGARELANGVRVEAASSAAKSVEASRAPETSPTQVTSFTPSPGSAARDLRVARASLVRSSELFRDLRHGLGPGAFAPASVGTDSLSGSVRP